jgi:hypothetical protein
LGLGEWSKRAPDRSPPPKVTDEFKKNLTNLGVSVGLQIVNDNKHPCHGEEQQDLDVPPHRDGFLVTEHTLECLRGPSTRYTYIGRRRNTENRGDVRHCVFAASPRVGGTPSRSLMLSRGTDKDAKCSPRPRRVRIATLFVSGLFNTA